MPDDHSAARDRAHGAVFALMRVESSRRPRIPATLASAGVIGLVAIGALNHLPGGTQIASVADTQAPPAATQPARTLRSSRPPPHGSLGAGLANGSPTGADAVETGETGALAIQATRRPSTVAIQGAVFAQQANAVLFTMRSLDGEIADSIARLVPAMLADGRNHRPSWPMNVELTIPTALASTALVIEAEVYGPDGVRIDGIRLRHAPEI
jgi:hypothetical protein